MNLPWNLHWCPATLQNWVVLRMYIKVKISIYIYYKYLQLANPENSEWIPFWEDFVDFSVSWPTHIWTIKSLMFLPISSRFSKLHPLHPCSIVCAQNIVNSEVHMLFQDLEGWGTAVMTSGNRWWWPYDSPVYKSYLGCRYIYNKPGWHIREHQLRKDYLSKSTVNLHVCYWNVPFPAMLTIISPYFNLLSENQTCQWETPCKLCVF